jgi:mediator of RNA polymerase II transcription subunit 24
VQDQECPSPSSKLLRLSTGVTETADTEALFGSTASSSQNSDQPHSNGNQPATIKEPLQKALNDLFHTFTLIVGRDGEISQQTHFVCKFLQFVVCCGRDKTQLVLQGMPNTLVCEIH